ncbi:MAG TPA: DNA repair protein RecN, partial [Alphaproteobacteria bacterium]|nr:DNA repair protein RecN [Alphaproteobacteria bacterium]
MLLSLNINNILIIDKISAEFSDKFNVITGETGSGKSVILESLLLALGERNLNLAPQNSQKGLITISFDVSKNKKVKELLVENDIEFDQEILVKRTISENRSVSYIN